ncbi:MAG: hypothetical protein CML45_05650 [Rhodobacteraceae bacterium]|nr:hypothetical protein [Paracoccaceae bacterium]|tara:strand:- start:1529 stop:4693 length:3165 start_codon:yes stop_codon:yes gene_type:complete
MKYKRYAHKDITIDGFDSLRKALGTIVKVKAHSPPHPYVLTPREEFYYLDRTTEAFTINNFDFTDERGLSTRYATIEHDIGNKYRIFDKFLTNPAKIVPIDEEKLLPNFRVPFRIIVNEELTRGDKYWYTVFMGGKVNDVNFPKLVELDKVFYNLFFRYYLYEPRHIYTGEGYRGSDWWGEQKFYNITCKYPDYNKYVSNYQQWASDKHELLLPSMLFEMQVRSDRIDIPSIAERSEAAAAESAAIMADARSPAHGERKILENFKDQTESYIDLLNYYFPKNYPVEDELNIYAGAELFPGSGENVETIEMFVNDGTLGLEKDEYFGDRWIYNWNPSTELKNKVINAQKNIFITSDYLAYTAEALRYRIQIQEGVERFKFKQQTSNLNYVYVDFDRDYDPYGWYASATGWRSNHDSIRTLETEEYRARYDFRDILDRNDLSTKFLETIKDMEEGAITDISYTNDPIKASTFHWRPAPDMPSANAGDYYIDNIKLQTLDYFEFLTYIYNNHSTAINDDYVTLGPLVGGYRPAPTPSAERSRTAEDRLSYGDNLLYRYATSKNISSAIAQSIEKIRKYYERLLPHSLESSVSPDEGLSHSSVPELDNLIFEKIVDINSQHIDVLGYKIEKTGGKQTGDSRTQNHIQNFWIWNRGKDGGFTPEKTLMLADSQVKIGHSYTYTAYAYLTVLGMKYKYSDFRLTKMTNAYDLELSERGFEIDGELDLYCVQFYDPTDMIIKPQNLTISSVGERNPEGYEFSNLAEYNTFATSEFDILDSPQAADFHLNFEPCLKIVKVPIFQKTVTVYDNPGNKISVEPFHVINNDNKIGFNIVQDNFRPSKYPAVITPNDQTIKDNYLHTKNLKDTDINELFSESPARYLEVYRTRTKPTSYQSFASSIVSKIDLRLENTHFNRTDYSLVDQITPNVKYYYLFRLVTENNMPGHVSTIYEATLVDDGGYKYTKFNTFDSSQFIVDNFQETSKSFKKILKLEPNINQLTLDTADADFTKRARDQLDNVKIGNSEKSIFDGKKFKIRLTSKKTGKKTDLNVTFNLKNKVLY